ncbi:MAG: serine protease [Actinomycetota bacterium]
MLGRWTPRRRQPVVCLILAGLLVIAGCSATTLEETDAGNGGSRTDQDGTGADGATSDGAGTDRTEPDVAASVFRVKANRCASPENSWTTGFAVDADTIATVAHALESTLAVTVIDVDEVEYPVEVAYVDEAKDIALLRLLDTTAEPLPVADEEADGDVWLVTFKQKEEQPVFQPASVLSLVEVTMDGEGARDAIKLTADISVGDSGGPVVNDDGQLLGMIFATTINERTGWAIAQPEVSAALEAKNRNRPEVIPPACTTDPMDPVEPESESADADRTDSG